MDQKEIESLIAAGGAPCEICGGRMLKVDGCTWPGVYSRGKYYKRIKYGDEDFAWPDERCHDCGAKLGTLSSCQLRCGAVPSMRRAADRLQL